MKLKISEITDINGLYFLGKLYKCIWMVLGYFHDLLRLPLDGRGEAHSKISII